MLYFGDLRACVLSPYDKQRLPSYGCCLTYDYRPQVLEDGTLVLRRLDHRGAGRYACRVETGVGRRTTHFHNSQYLFHQIDIFFL